MFEVIDTSGKELDPIKTLPLFGDIVSQKGKDYNVVRVVKFADGEEDKYKYRVVVEARKAKPAKPKAKPKEDSK